MPRRLHTEIYQQWEVLQERFINDIWPKMEIINYSLHNLKAQIMHPLDVTNIKPHFEHIGRTMVAILEEFQDSRNFMELRITQLGVSNVLPKIELTKTLQALLQFVEIIDESTRIRHLLPAYIFELKFFFNHFFYTHGHFFD